MTTIPPGADVVVVIPNARVAKRDPETGRYFVHSPAFYGGAWIESHNIEYRDPFKENR